MLSKQKRQRSNRNNGVHLLPLFQGVKEALTHDLSDDHMRKAVKNRVRGGVVPINDGCPPYVYKKFKQLLDFDKRIIWNKDKSFAELSRESLIGFLNSQVDFGLSEPMSRRASLVIHRAGEICGQILGPFSYDRWLDSCAFGKRAATGLPKSKSYLDTRFSRISGTPLQLATFNVALARDIHLLRAVRKTCGLRKEIASVRAATVPKSFKAARVMFPDTILGGFLSRGLGDYIREELERNTNIDLKKQQERHRRWAQGASIKGQLATIDMSKASDSFVRRHIELLVPRDWHHALDVCRTSHVKLEKDGDTTALASFMLMGSGHTFPLQTLLFYCLAEATRELLESSGRVSVYGDDIIIPVLMASPFIIVMTELGFKVNSEKSFYDLPDPDRPSHTFFRESCGGDYKGGIDVRPYMPECDLQSITTVPRNEYVAWCHKLINGLLTRWDICEIGNTVGFLLRCISANAKKVCFVPSWEVDHAGIKFYLPDYLLLGHECERMRYVRCVPIYRKLILLQKKRKRGMQERPYYWYSLQLKQRKVAANTAYDKAISLTGEPRKDVVGQYRWKMQNLHEDDVIPRWPKLRFSSSSKVKVVHDQRGLRVFEESVSA